LAPITLLALFGALLVSGVVRSEIGWDAAGARQVGSTTDVPDSVKQGGPIVDTTGGQPRSMSLPDRTVLLTFDDGPDPKWTPRILAELRRERVPAVFFVVGAAAVRHPDLLRQIRDSGSELGVHTFTHPDLGRMPAWRTQMELSEAQLVLAGTAGVTSSVMRPPYSAGTDAVDNTAWSVIQDSGRRGYLTMLSEQDSEDWRRPGVNKIVANSTPPDHRGRILLLHDAGGDRSQTVAALGPLIRGLKAKGFRFISASEALRTGTVNPSADPDVRWRGQALIWTVRVSNVVLGLVWAFLAVVGALTVARLLLMLVVAHRHVRRRRARGFRWGSRVTDPVSVIVPAYNEEKCIAATVRSLWRSRYPAVEVIVVDDGSTDRTAEVVENLNLPGVTVLRKANSGKSSALNIGIAAASYDLIVMVDGDTVFEPDAIRWLVQPFADPRIGAVAGNVKVANRGRLLGLWQHIEYVTGFNIDRRLYETLQCMPTIPGAIGAFRREALADVGGVSGTTLAEDTDLTMAIARTGWRIVFEDRAKAWTEAPQSLGQLWRQRYRWSYGTMQAMWKHRRSVVESGPSGRFGRRALLVLALFQVVLPTFAPLIDLFLLYGLVFLDPLRTVGFWLGVLVIQMIGGWYAFRLDRERLWPLLFLPLQQFVYRQLMYLVIIQSVASAFAGVRMRWQKLDRLGRSEQPMPRRGRVAPAHRVSQSH
jgi:cellulose synthase/poly-beta-1,6-N-acetylglucosamine synthase-like glycosyltransferase/peptidoglycan/xylan/chitin deacetylase (PgdA/CDA1 family)